MVIGLGHPHAKGNQSGIGFDSELGLVWLMRDGRVAGGRSLLSHADAESEAERLAREAASA